MSREFPDWINPWSAAEGRRRFEGTIPLVRLKRLASELVDDNGTAMFRAEFSLDSERNPVIELEVDAQLRLECQASLAPYIEPIHVKTQLGVVNDLASAQLLPEHLDPVSVENRRLALAMLVEDELLLALPAVPRDPNIEEVKFQSGKMELEDELKADRRNPFAGLKEKLKAGQ